MLKFVVYRPPSVGLPFLAIAISANGREAIAKPFVNELEAIAYKDAHALWTFEQLKAIECT